MTYVQESPHTNKSRRRRARLAGALALALAAALVAASLAGIVPAVAQASSVSVDDFDQSGLQVVALASFTAGGATTLYSAADSRWDATGSLVEGDVNLSADSKIVRVMAPDRNGSLLRLNDDGPLVLRAYFGESGAGADLTVWLQTDAGTASFAANDFKTAGGGYVNFNVPATGRAILTGIGAGDRFVLALTRPEPTPEPPPAPTEEPVEETTPPSVTLSATTPVEGKSFTATLVDPDDSVSGESWSWSSSTTTTGSFTAITGATSAIYTPVAGDVGSYLRVTASYTDSSESDQTVSVDSANATIANPSPIFADALVTFSVAEDATTDDAVGTVTATDPDNDTLTYSVGGTDAVEFDENFNLNASSGAITVKSDATIDYDERSSYAVTITATDTFDRTDTVDVTITVDEPEVVRGQSNSEPDAGDLPGTSDTTGLVALDQAARGRLTESTALWDTDWFAADLTAGRTYRIQVLGAPGVDCTLLAPIVESLHDASGTVVAGTEWSDESRELWSA